MLVLTLKEAAKPAQAVLPQVIGVSTDPKIALRRVALTPDSTFYLYNGKPYYLLPVQPRWMMPYMLD